jgi:hypothetical protein
MKPTYQYIEFCRNAETLWHKIASGHWDWLGVHPERKFVLGRPARRAGATLRAASTVGTVGAPEGQHGVFVQAPLDPGPSRTWFKTQQEAKEEYARVVSSFSGDEKGPGLLRVRHVERGQIVEEAFLVRRSSTYL